MIQVRTSLTRRVSKDGAAYRYCGSYAKSRSSNSTKASSIAIEPYSIV